MTLCNVLLICFIVIVSFSIVESNTETSHIIDMPIESQIIEGKASFIQLSDSTPDVRIRSNIKVDSDGSFGGLLKTINFQADNDGAIYGNLNIGKDLSVANAISAAVTNSKNIVVTDTIKTTHFIAKGDMTSVTANILTDCKANKFLSNAVLATTLVQSNQNVVAMEYVTAGKGITTEGSISSDGSIFSKNDVHADAYLTARRGITTSGSLTATMGIDTDSDIKATGQVIADKGFRTKSDFIATGMITSNTKILVNGPIEARGDVRATGNVYAETKIVSGGAIYAETIVDANKINLRCKSKDDTFICVEVNGPVKMTGDVHINGKLFVGNRSVGDEQKKTEATLELLKEQLAAVQLSLSQALTLLKESSL